MTTSATPSDLPVVQAGSFLTLHYRLAGPAGDVINTFNEKPATLSLGAGELSPAMEDKLIGLAEGTHTTFELPAGEAFGERNPDMMQWVARKLMNELGDPHEQYTAGDVVQFPTPDGNGSYAGGPCTESRTVASFTVVCASAPSASSYTLTATGSGPTAGFAYTLDQNGRERSTALPADWGTAPAGCWILRAGRTC